MPREARVVEENACYHIITRGNQQQRVFEDISDKEKFGFKTYCFCLMPNHVHLLLDIKTPHDLQKTMLGLNLSYTMYFNNKYEKIGHLWQGRFISRVIQRDEYFLKCIEYIENNPLEQN